MPTSILKFSQTGSKGLKKTSEERKLIRLRRTVRYERAVLKAQQLKVKNAEDEMKELSSSIKSQKDLQKQFDKERKAVKKAEKKKTVIKTPIQDAKVKKGKADVGK